MPTDASSPSIRPVFAIPRTRSASLRYGITLSVVAVSALISLWLRPFSSTTPFLFFYPAVIFSAWFGGLGPGLLATVLCSLTANYFLLSPYDRFSLDPSSLIRTFLFAAGFAGICWLAELARKQFRSIISIQSQLLDLTLDPIIVRDEEDRIIYWNEGAERLYQWTKEEAYGQRSHTLLKTQFPIPFDQIRSELTRTGRWHGELTRTKKDGSSVVVASSWTLQVERAHSSAILEANFDLTDRKQSERALQVSEEMLRVVFNSVYDGIVLHSQDGTIIDVNDRFLALYKISQEDISQLTIADISSPSSPIETLPSLWSKVMAGQSQFFEWKALRPHDKSEFDVEVFLNRVQLRGRDAVLANVRDITERKRSEDEKHTLHMQLAQAQKMEAIGRMAGGIAHDFNNLLGVILGYSELALRSDPAKASQSLGQIQKATSTAAALTRQLLTLSRKEVLEPRIVDLCDVLHQTVAMLPRLLGEDIQVRTDFCTENCATRMTPGQLEQIILNLAVNARDAMPRGGTLSFSTSCGPVDDTRGDVLTGLSPGTYVVISVTDTGEGMAEDLIPKIFEPFFTTKKPGKGTGLGLSTVSNIVNQNGGRIFVDSVLGCGSTFTIYLPKDEATPRERTDTAVRTDLQRGSETILLVEDSAALCEMTKTFLEMQGYTVHAAPNGVEALAILQKVGPQVDLLFTDIVMPLMSGPQLAQKVREFQPHLRILYASGHSGELLEQHGTASKGIRMLEKPYSFEKLAATVRESLDDLAA